MTYAWIGRKDTGLYDHILPVFEYGQQDSWHYLVMPYAAHGTLADLLKKKGALSSEEAGTPLEHIANALQLAHEHGILHRDIKPSHILLHDEAGTSLADFGITKSQDQKNSSHPSWHRHWDTRVYGTRSTERAS